MGRFLHGRDPELEAALAYAQLSLQRIQRGGLDQVRVEAVSFLRRIGLVPPVSPLKHGPQGPQGCVDPPDNQGDRHA